MSGGVEQSEIEPLHRPTTLDTEVLTPPLSDKTTPTEDNKMEHTLQINGCTGAASDEEGAERSKKSSLSLPVEPLNGCALPQHHDRRKLSVQGLMGFADRRRSSGAFLSELTRKMSITNSDGFGSRSPGGVGTYIVMCKDGRGLCSADGKALGSF